MLITGKDTSKRIMKRVFFKKSLLVGVAVLSLASAAPLVAQAQAAYAEKAQISVHEREAETQMNTKGQSTEVKTNIEEQQGGTRTSTEEHTATTQTRLGDAKLKTCQNRERAVTNIMVRLGDRGQKQIDLFNTIAERTEKFYTDKGKALTNYDALVGDVAAKKTAAQSAVSTVKSTSVEFKCDSNDPKGVAATFKERLKAEIVAMKAYKTSVKNLIVGVKSVQRTASSTGKEATNENAQ